MAGNHILPEASCDTCRDTTSAFEARFQRGMYAATRAIFGLYGKRKNPDRPKTFEVRLLGKDLKRVQPAIPDYPYSIFMPLLDAPTILSGKPPYQELPDLREPGRIWQWTDPDANEKGKKLAKQHSADFAMATQPIVLSDFYKVLAKIAHSFAIAVKGYDEIAPFLLPKLIRAPKGVLTFGATHYVGAAFNKGLRFVAQPTENAHQLSLNQHYMSDMMRITTVRIQLFAWLGSPVYEVAVSQRIGVVIDTSPLR